MIYAHRSTNMQFKRCPFHNTAVGTDVGGSIIRVGCIQITSETRRERGGGINVGVPTTGSVHVVMLVQ